MKALLSPFALSCCLSLTAISSVFSSPVFAQSQNMDQIVIYSSDSNPLNQAFHDAVLNTQPGVRIEVIQGTGQPDLNQEMQTGPLSLRQAQLILQPRWTWGELVLTGPHSNGEAWVIRAEAELNLELTVTEVNSGSTGERKILRRNWRVSKDIPIRNTEQLLAVVKQASGLEADLYNNSHREKVLEVVRQIPAFKELLALEPSVYLGGVSEEKIRQSDFYDFVKTWQEMTLQVNSTQPNPVQSQFTSNPGDSKKIGLNIALRGGTLPLWLSGPAQSYQPFPESFFNPHFHLDLEYELKSLLNLENTFVVLSGGTNIPVSLSPYDAQALQQQIDPTLLYSTALGVNGELGLSYKLDFGSWLLHMGARGGIIGGFLMSQVATPTGPPSTLGFGGTALLGAQWKWGSDFLLGMDTGFRYYSFTSPWSITNPGFPQPQFINFPPLSSWGPVLQAYISYRL